MQIEIYNMTAVDSSVTITLEAVCDSFSSLLWDVQYYYCGRFEVYIAANAVNMAVFQIGKIIGRDDDKQHFGIIESVKLNTDIENGDYLTVTGRFLMSLLSRRIIVPTLNFSTLTSYGDMLQTAVRKNCMQLGKRKIPGLSVGSVSGDCWKKKARLQISYSNLMEWIYKICDLVGGTANIRLQEKAVGSGQYEMLFELSQGNDRSAMQNINPHIVFSDTYNNLLTFDYLKDCSEYSNFAYIYGCGEGTDRKHTDYYSGTEPLYLERYEVFVDAKDISDEEQTDSGEKIPISDTDYTELLKEKGAESIVPVTEESESTIVTDGRQYRFNEHYFVGDFVTVQHERFGLEQSKIQLTGMVECFDQNGYSLTPTFEGGR